MSESGKNLHDAVDSHAERLQRERFRANDDPWFKGWSAGHDDGWRNAMAIYGLRDCTIRNDSQEEMRVPIGRREAYIDLEPGEQITIRTVADDS